MSNQVPRPSERPGFNLLQIIALNIAASIALCLGLAAAGAPWHMAVFGAWIGGSILTVLITFTIVHNQEKRAARHPGGEMPMMQVGPDLVPLAIIDPLQIWEADRLLELDHVRMTGRVDPDRKPRRATPPEMVRTWEADADEDSRTGFAAPTRSPGRQLAMPFIAENRRTSRRWE